MSNFVCEDLVVNIFERLPPKSVIRFKSLSKSWNSHLASPDFIRKHNLQSFNKNSCKKVLVRHLYFMRNPELRDVFVLHSGDGFLLNSECENMEIKGVEYFPKSDPLSLNDIVGSCNGILCLNDKGIINLWNVSIRRKLTLPSHPSSRCSKKEPDALYGFGLDPITDDYKIVCISYGKDEDNPSDINTYIYSLKRNSWNAIASPTSLFSDVDSNSCFFNGTLHWVVYGESLSIMTFCLTTHVFGTFSIPESSDRGILVIRQLNIINGSLALISSNRNHNQIWVMQEYGNVETWSKIYEFSIEDPGLIKVLQPIPNGDLLIHGECPFYPRWCYVYNPRIEKLTKLKEFGSLRFKDVVRRFNLETETYVESLELLDRGIACGKTRILLVKKKNHKRKFTSLDYADDGL